MTGRLAAAAWLSLAAAPVFAAMALATSLDADHVGLPICAPAAPASRVDPMAVMYLLMSAFHAGPWLRLGRRPPAD